MYQIILFGHVLVAVFLIVLVLIQQGKGATMGAAFGSGASQTVFGSRGSGSFLLKITVFFVVLFFASSLALSYIASKQAKEAKQSNLNLPQELMTKVPVTTPSTLAPATPVTPPAADQQKK